MRLLIVIFYVILILVGISFAALNANPVLVNLYFIKLTMPISVLMTAMFGVGLFLGMILVLLRYWRLKMAYIKLKNQFNLTAKEIKNLRSIPLKD
ncbi:MAG: LapA family protein [Legionella sp.]|nr:LapA family protein [Legionella sp.]